eukprot:RCo038423
MAGTGAGELMYTVWRAGISVVYVLAMGNTVAVAVPVVVVVSAGGEAPSAGLRALSRNREGGKGADSPTVVVVVVPMGGKGLLERSREGGNKGVVEAGRVVVEVGKAVELENVVVVVAGWGREMVEVDKAPEEPNVVIEGEPGSATVVVVVEGKVIVLVT